MTRGHQMTTITMQSLFELRIDTITYNLKWNTRAPLTKCIAMRYNCAHIDMDWPRWFVFVDAAILQTPICNAYEIMNSTNYHHVVASSALIAAWMHCLCRDFPVNETMKQKAFSVIRAEFAAGQSFVLVYSTHGATYFMTSAVFGWLDGENERNT